MATEKQTEANRRNSQKSTGPKSDEGKARSSKNALKHGMTAAADTFVPGDDPGALDTWVDSLRPDDPAQLALVTRACLASVRLDRCARHEDAVLAQKARHAPILHDLQRRNRARELGRQLTFEPINRLGDADALAKAAGRLAAAEATDYRSVRAEMETTAEGVDWLIAKWWQLAAVLQDQGWWHYPEKFMATRLLGRRPEDLLIDPLVARVFNGCHVAHPNSLSYQNEAIQSVLGLPHAPVYYKQVEVLESKAPKTREEAYALLGQTALQEIERLNALKQGGLDELAALDRAEAADRALFDDGPGAALRLRYEAAASRELQRSLSELTKLRKAAAAEAKEPRSAPKVEPQPVALTGVELSSAAAATVTSASMSPSPRPVRNEAVGEGSVQAVKTNPEGRKGSKRRRDRR